MKKVIILATIVIMLSSSYYFVLFLPSQKFAQSQQDRQTFLFEKKSECKNICESLYKDDLKSFPEPDNSVFNPQYAYNEEKNACFYSGGWLSFKPKGSTNRVVNCQTNEEVLSYITVDDKVFTSFCDTCVSTIEGYRLKEKEFLGK